MKIKDKLYFSTLISIILGIIFVYLLLITSNVVVQKNQELQLAEDISNSVSELNIITYEYLLRREKQMEEQWDVKYNSGAKIIRKADKEKIQNISGNYVELGRLFLQVTRGYKKTQSFIQAEVPQEKIDLTILQEERLVTQLLINSQLIISESSKLSEKSLQEITQTQELINTLALILMIIITMIITSTSLITVRSISKPLDKLTKGTEIIGKGNLEYKIDVKSKDEIGELATAFNKMTNNLGSSREQLKNYSENLKERAKELEEKISELEKFHKMTVGRELRMIELKNRIKELEAKKGGGQSNRKKN